jgi:hypothetical protein
MVEAQPIQREARSEMGVGPIRGGGGRSGIKGAGRAGAKGAVGKASGKSFGKADAVESLVGPSGAAGSSEVGAAAGASGTAAVGSAGVVEQAGAIAKALRTARSPPRPRRLAGWSRRFSRNA